MTVDQPVVALVGQPNSGKTTLFNRLTGARQKVGNYPGVTVEKRAGHWLGNEIDCQLVDLPGLYDLAGAGIDERIAATELFGLQGSVAPQVAIVVLDITQIERGLYLLAEVLHLGVPTVVALNMADSQKADGIEVDLLRLEEKLQSPVVQISARHGQGIDRLESVVHSRLHGGQGQRAYKDNAPLRQYLSAMLARDPVRWSEVLQGYEDLDRDGEDQWKEVQATLTETVEEWIRTTVARPRASETRRRTVRIDDLILHPVWGMVIFMLVMLMLFQTVYAWSNPLITAIESSIGWLSSLVYTLPLTPMLKELLVEAGLTGAGNVLVFLPQILILFLWIAVLEETGYLARVGFMLDKPMRLAGLSGRSFIPLLSSFACAVPGIMAARTIENPRTRLTTILVAPLMTCSARLPVYTVLIGAFVPEQSVWGLNVRGLILFALYAAGVLSALVLAKMIQRGLKRGIPIPMILELPVYRWPHLRNVLQTLQQRSWMFIRRAGTIIFGVSVILWFALHFPRDTELQAKITREQGASAAAIWQVEHSAAGRVGQIIEPVIRPLGFDWKIGVSLIASFAAREVMVATLGTIYNVEEATEESVSLRSALRSDPVWDLPTALAMLVWYIFALQCVSTVAIMRRETGSWKWPLGALASTYGLAWVLGMLVYQVASRI